MRVSDPTFRVRGCRYVCPRRVSDREVSLAKSFHEFQFGGMVLRVLYCYSRAWGRSRCNANGGVLASPFLVEQIHRLTCYKTFHEILPTFSLADPSFGAKENDHTARAGCGPPPLGWAERRCEKGRRAGSLRAWGTWNTWFGSRSPGLRLPEAHFVEAFTGGLKFPEIGLKLPGIHHMRNAGSLGVG